METKRFFAVIVVLFGLATVPAYSQFPFPSPTPGNEPTTSFGAFKILVDPHAASLFTGCPAPMWDGHYLTSPLLYDSAGTIIGVSAITTSTSAPVGASPPTTIGDTNFVHPPAGFSGAGPRIYTQIRALPLRTYGAGPVVTVSVAPARPSAGEVRPDGATAKSFFEAYVQISIPGCPSPSPFHGATLYNKTNAPLIVEASGLTSLPPSVVYNHMVSNEVPIQIRIGRKEEFLGCIILAAHQVGVAGTPEGGGPGQGNGPGKGKGPQKTMPAQSERGREEFEKQKAAFEAHMKEAERGMPHNCKGEREPVKAQ